MKKIYTDNELTSKIFNEKNLGKKIVLCHGVFDLIHIGHLKHFRAAKKMGDILVVSLTPDKFVNKGIGRPIFNEKYRAEAISSIEYVDYVIINNAPTSINLIKKIKPNIYCKGPDYKDHSKDITNQIKNEINVIKSVKGRIAYTQEETFSSSNLINKNFGFISDLENKFLSIIKKNFEFSRIKKIINKFYNLKILVIGEIIIDQYVYCEALGKSGKEPVLVLREINKEEYVGGSGAISRHLSSFCKNITLLSMLGEKKEYLNKIKKDIPINVKLKFLNKKNSPTILKKRFLDNVSKHKVLGVYNINDDLISKNQEKQLIKNIKKEINKNDLIIVSDYGHGFLSPKSSKIICKSSKNVYVNSQINASNVGYHTLKNYKGVKCIIINEKELRHELRNKNDDIKVLMKQLSIDQKIHYLIVTQGNTGVKFYDKRLNKFTECPAFAKTAVDKIGAGDTMLSLVALCLQTNTDINLSLLIGSLAAAHSVQSVGNKDSINKVQILKSLETILK